MALTGYLKELRDVVGHRPLLVPASCALIFNKLGEVLLHRSSDDGKWHTLGGTIEPGEEPADAARREAFEETGLHVVPERLVGVYAWSRIEYPNGDICDYIGNVFACRIESGTLSLSDESLEFSFLAQGALPELLPIEQVVIADAFAGVTGRFLTSI